MRARRFLSGPPSVKNVRYASNVASYGWGIKAPSVLQTEDGDWQEFLGIKLFYESFMKIQQSFSIYCYM